MSAFGFNGSFDAFGRLRTSETGQRGDFEFLYNKMPEYFDEVTVTGGTVSHNVNARDLTLAVNNTTTDTEAAMYSFPTVYTPGNSQLVDITGVMDLANLGGTASIFLRSNISGTPVDLYETPQGSWLNLTSGVDWADSHIFTFDFQSLKVGTVKAGFVQGGKAIQCVQFDNDNVRSSGYWQQANLPMFWRIYNTATETITEMGYGDEKNAIGLRFTMTKSASATMKAICGTVKSEGGQALYDLSGLPWSASMAGVAKTVSTTKIPLISIRSRDTFYSIDNLILSIPKRFTLQTSNAIRYEVIADATLTGESFSNVSTFYSAIEKDVAATAVSGGRVVAEDYIWANTSGGGFSNTNHQISKSLLGKSLLWNRRGSQTGILTLAAIRTGSNDSSVLAAFSGEDLR